MGLFALASLLFAQRKREVSIRKVLGAEPSGLIVMLLKNFTYLVLGGIVVGIPVSYLIMNNWLSNFNTKTDLDPTLFLFSAALLLVISWATIGYLTFRTSRINPVDTLRAE